MKTAFFADIHANREALEACLRHAEKLQIDRYAFLGDLIGYGADPSWAIDTVMDYHSRGAIVLLGNHDEAVLSRPEMSMHDDARYVVSWTRSQLSTAQMNFLKELPLVFDKYEMFMTHANVFKPQGWEYVTNVIDAKKSFSATFDRFIFCGHLHEPVLYHQGATGKVVQFIPVAGVDIPMGITRRWLAVIGSVGQPRDINPAACYAIYDSSRNTLTYFRVPYDIATASKKIADAGLPVWLGDRLERGV